MNAISKFDHRDVGVRSFPIVTSREGLWPAPVYERQPDIHAGLAERILIACGEVTARNQLRDYFEARGFDVHAVASGQDLVRDLATGAPSLILLDMRLRVPDAGHTMQQIRSQSEVPTIILADDRCEEADRIRLLEAGADDCVSSSLSVRELLAHVRAVLRRQPVARGQAKGRERGGFKFAGWQLLRRYRRLLNPDGEQVSLTKAEYALLVAFLEQARRPLTRQQLLQATRMHEDVFDRSIDVQVLRLRRKLDGGQGEPTFIRTQRGIGYVFDIPVDVY